MSVWLERPLPLLQPTSGGLELNESTVRQLEKITHPLVVVSIAGKYRTGKSYILNLLSNLPRGSGFELGSTVQSKTKGVWVYALPHPLLSDTALLLIDTEGLGDVDKGDKNYDVSLLILSVLLSSTFIFNVVGRLDDDDINQLGFVASLSKILVHERSLGDRNFNFVPLLFVLLRDFCLELSCNGKEITATEYLDNYCLKEKEGDKFDANNDLKRLIRKQFPTRYCATLPPPVYNKELLRRLETVPDEDLDPEFVEESREFVQHVLDFSEPKRCTGQTPMDGKIFLNLLRHYLEQINRGALPCIETSLQSMATLENIKLLKDYAHSYYLQVHQLLELPVSSELLVDTHESLLSGLIEDFKQKITFDVNEHEMVINYKVEVDEIFNKLSRENEELSRQECLNRLNLLSQTLNDKRSMNAFQKQGGYADYSDEVENIIAAYNDVDEKSVKHEEVLSQFVKETEEEGRHILAMEEALLEAQVKDEE